MNTLHLAFFVDANCVNARQRNEALNELEHWQKKGCITLLYSDTAFTEAAFQSLLRRTKVFNFSYVQLNALHEPDRASLFKVVFKTSSATPHHAVGSLMYQRFCSLKSKRQKGGVRGGACAAWT